MSREECGPQDCMDCAWAGNATESTNAQSCESLSLRLQAWRRKPRKAIRSLSAGWVDACKTLQALLEGDVQTNVYHFNAVLGAVGRTQRWPRALQMLCSMLHAETADLVSLNTVIHAGEKKQWQMAHSLLCLLHDLGGVPNAISYNSCISACYGVAWPRALHLADSMVSCATALAPRLHVNIGSVRQRPMQWTRLCDAVHSIQGRDYMQQCRPRMWHRRLETDPLPQVKQRFEGIELLCEVRHVTPPSAVIFAFPASMSNLCESERE